MKTLLQSKTKAILFLNFILFTYYIYDIKFIYLAIIILGGHAMYLVDLSSLIGVEPGPSGVKALSHNHWITETILNGATLETLSLKVEIK